MAEYMIIVHGKNEGRYERVRAYRTREQAERLSSSFKSLILTDSTKDGIRYVVWKKLGE